MVRKVADFLLDVRIKKVDVRGSILGLVMRRCVLGKTFSASFRVGSKSLFVVVAQPVEGFKQTRKWCLVFVRLDKCRVLNSYA